MILGWKRSETSQTNNPQRHFLGSDMQVTCFWAPNIGKHLKIYKDFQGSNFRGPNVVELLGREDLENKHSETPSCPQSFVHKIAFPPPPPKKKSVTFGDILLILYNLLILDPFQRGGKPNFEENNFMDTQTFSEPCSIERLKFGHTLHVKFHSRLKTSVWLCNPSGLAESPFSGRGKNREKIAEK